MDRLTPKQFRAVIRARGYRFSEVAKLWGVSPGRITQIADDLERPIYFDYALWGLVPRKAAAMVAERRIRSARAWAGPAPAEHHADQVDSSCIEIGDVWAVRESPGEHLPEGCEGTVYALESRGGVPRAAFLFAATGYRETFEIAYLNDPACFLSPTGRQVADGVPE